MNALIKLVQKATVDVSFRKQLAYGDPGTYGFELTPEELRAVRAVSGLFEDWLDQDVQPMGEAGITWKVASDYQSSVSKA
jgi:hypothetical protein